MSVSHSACVLQVVHSRFQDLVPVHLKDEHNAELMRPDDEEISEVICVLLLQFFCFKGYFFNSRILLSNRSLSSHGYKLIWLGLGNKHHVTGKSKPKLGSLPIFRDFGQRINCEGPSL